MGYNHDITEVSHERNINTSLSTGAVQELIFGPEQQVHPVLQEPLNCTIHYSYIIAIHYTRSTTDFNENATQNA